MSSVEIHKLSVACLATSLTIVRFKSMQDAVGEGKHLKKDKSGEANNVLHSAKLYVYTLKAVDLADNL